MPQPESVHTSWLPGEIPYGTLAASSVAIAPLARDHWVASAWLSIVSPRWDATLTLSEPRLSTIHCVWALKMAAPDVVVV